MGQKTAGVQRSEKTGIQKNRGKFDVWHRRKWLVPFLYRKKEREGYVI